MYIIKNILKLENSLELTHGLDCCSNRPASLQDESS